MKNQQSEEQRNKNVQDFIEGNFKNSEDDNNNEEDEFDKAEKEYERKKKQKENENNDIEDDDNEKEENEEDDDEILRPFYTHINMSQQLKSSMNNKSNVNNINVNKSTNFNNNDANVFVNKPFFPQVYKHPEDVYLKENEYIKKTENRYKLYDRGTGYYKEDNKNK